MKFIYTGIKVRDLKRSLEFYTKTMDMKETSRGKMEDGGTFVELKRRGFRPAARAELLPLWE